jgi:hypothetical protein
MKILINAAGETIIDEVNYPDRVGLLAGSFIQLDLADDSSPATAGTLTFEFKTPGGLAYSIPDNGNTIDCSAPVPLVIGPNSVGSIKCTATGVSGGVGGKIALVVLGFS